MDQMYIGELYVDRDFEDGKLKGSSCKFNLGTKTAVEKYIQVCGSKCWKVAWIACSTFMLKILFCASVFRQQFTEIVTEEGRRPVKITHVVPGQAAKICSTQGAVESLYVDFSTVFSRVHATL